MKSRLKVICIIAYWHAKRFKNKPGGLIRIFELADNLTRQGKRITLILPRIGYPKTQTIAKVIEVPFLDLPLLRPFSFHLISCLVLLIKMIERMDLLYVRQMNSFHPLIIAKLFKVKTIFELPNDPYLAYPSSKRVRRLLVRLIDRYSMVLADKIVVLSEWSKRRLNQLGGISLSKIIVIPSGTDTNLFVPKDKEKCCRELGYDPSFIYIGFVGSFLAHQGVDTLIDAAKIMEKNLANIKFLLVGDGPMFDAWKNKVDQEGLSDRFIFTGHIPYINVPLYIGAMDICVAPHRKDSNQSSPVKLFDYMGCGRPIVASDIDVVREIIEDSGCSILIPPDRPDELARGIQSVIEDPIKRKIMGAKGRAFILGRYSRQTIFKKLSSIVNGLKDDSFQIRSCV